MIKLLKSAKSYANSSQVNTNPITLLKCILRFVLNFNIAYSLNRKLMSITTVVITILNVICCITIFRLFEIGKILKSLPRPQTIFKMAVSIVNPNPINLLKCILRFILDFNIASSLNKCGHQTCKSNIRSLYSEILHQFMSFCRLQTTLQLHHYSHCHMLYYYTQALWNWKDIKEFAKVDVKDDFQNGWEY